VSDTINYLQTRALFAAATEVEPRSTIQVAFEETISVVLNIFGTKLSSKGLRNILVDIPQPLLIIFNLAYPFSLWIKTAMASRDSQVLSSRASLSNPLLKVLEYQAQVTPRTEKAVFSTMPANKALGIILKDTTITRNSAPVDALAAKDLNIHFKAGDITVLYHDATADRTVCENIFDAIYGYDQVSKYYDKSGGIIIQGRKLEDWDSFAWREHVLYHKQHEARLFIHAGAAAGWLPGSSDSLLQQHRIVAKLLTVDKLIASLPQSFGTILREDLGLSESQWHRLTVCRALSMMIDKDLAMLSYPFDDLADNQNQLEEIFDLMRVHAKNHQQVIILTTQSPAVSHYGDKTITLEQGQVKNIESKSPAAAE
jgi:ABC-type transport system involved in cytochrome bd biosynthesis fused ATPase/permease subunit